MKRRPVRVALIIGLFACVTPLVAAFVWFKTLPPTPETPPCERFGRPTGTPFPIKEPSGRVSSLDGFAAFVTELEWSPDGTMLASSAWDCSVKIWDIESSSELYSWMVDWLPAQPIVWLPNQESLATVTRDRSLVEIRAVQTGRVIGTMDTGEGFITQLMWSEATGTLISVDSTGTVIRWDPATQQLVETIMQGSESYDNAALSPSETMLGFIVNIYDHEANRHLSTEVLVRSLDESGSRQQVLLAPTARLQALELSWSPDSSLLAVTTGNVAPPALHVWDMASHTQQYSQSLGSAYSFQMPMQWTPDGSQLAIGPWGYVYLYDADTWQIVDTLTTSSMYTSALALSPDGSVLAIGIQDRDDITLWEIPAPPAQP